MSSINSEAAKCNCVLGLSGCGEKVVLESLNAWLDSANGRL